MADAYGSEAAPDVREQEEARRTRRDQLRREEIVRAEKAVLAREERLAGALQEADARALAARRSIEALSARVARVLMTHGDAPQLLGVVRQLDGFEASPFDLGHHRARELAVREEAVRARDWLATALSAELQRFGEELELLELRLRDATAELDQLPEPTALAPPEAPRVSAALRARGGPRRRERPRVRMETVIDLTSPSNFFSGFSENLSDGGVFVATDRRVPLGTEVELSFRLPDGTQVLGRGLVRWSRTGHDATGLDVAPGVGVQFVELGGPAEEAVRRFLATRDPIFYPG